MDNKIEAHASRAADIRKMVMWMYTVSGDNIFGVDKMNRFLEYGGLLTSRLPKLQKTFDTSQV